MNWELHIEKLSNGEEVSFRPKGNSMQPRIESGNLVTISPIKIDINVGDIVFCKVSGNYYIHLVTAKDTDGRYQISNNKGFINGWTKTIYGKVVKIEE